MRLSQRSIPVLALAAGLAAAACSSSDVNGPDKVNPTTVASGVSGLSGSFSSNLAFQSLRELSGSFGFAAAVAASAALPPSGSAGAAARITEGQRAALLQLAARAPAAGLAIFPVNVLGKTLVWDTTLNRYVVDSTLSGAPANGVRFRLYLVGDTVLHRPQKPLIVVGYVDLTDESTAQANQLGVLVKYASQTIADYTVSGTVSTIGLALRSVGYLVGADGSSRLDFDLRIQVGQTGIDFNYALTGSNGFQAVLQVSANTVTNTATVLWRISGGGNSIEVDLTATTASTTGAIKFNDVTVATVTGTEGDPVITTVTGHVLTAQDLAALRAIFADFDDLMEQIDGVFGPAHLVFNF